MVKRIPYSVARQKLFAGANKLASKFPKEYSKCLEISAANLMK
jgi:hypothetical protein